MSASASDAPFPVDALAVVGVGLIGGSIAAAARARGSARRVIGIGRDRNRLGEARRAGLIDQASTSMEAAADADVVVVCTPVDHIARDVLAAGSHARPGTLITDAGSVKRIICRAVAEAGLPPEVDFVGAHPLAGSEKRGWEHADPNLFENRVCVVIAEAEDESDRTGEQRGRGATDPAAGRCVAFWRSLGMDVRVLSSEAHDFILARTSHLPHVAAAALTMLLSDVDRPFASTGFQDTTRIAAGDAALWTAILMQNTDALADATSRLIEQLHRVERALTAADADQLHQFLDEARLRRQSLD